MGCSCARLHPEQKSGREDSMGIIWLLVVIILIILLLRLL
jgi:hypothetical protein